MEPGLQTSNIQTLYSSVGINTVTTGNHCLLISHIFNNTIKTWIPLRTAHLTAIYETDFTLRGPFIKTVLILEPCAAGNTTDVPQFSKWDLW